MKNIFFQILLLHIPLKQKKLYLRKWHRFLLSFFTKEAGKNDYIFHTKAGLLSDHKAQIFKCYVGIIGEIEEEFSILEKIILYLRSFCLAFSCFFNCYFIWNQFLNRKNDAADESGNCFRCCFFVSPFFLSFRVKS
jgi:hypothetical protein